MSLPSGLRAAGDRLTQMGITVDAAPQQIIQNSRPYDGIEEVERLGQNGDILTGNPLFGGFGVPMNDEFRSAMDARDRLEDLREIGVYK